jgi:hypothetical protein
MIFAAVADIPRRPGKLIVAHGIHIIRLMDFCLCISLKKVMLFPNCRLRDIRGFNECHSLHNTILPSSAEIISFLHRSNMEISKSLVTESDPIP